MRQTPRHEDDKRREAPPAKDESHPVATGERVNPAEEEAYWRGNSGPAWDDVRPATRAAWERVDRRIQDATRN